MKHNAEAEVFDGSILRIERMLAALREALILDAIQGGFKDIASAIIRDLQRYIRNGFRFVEERLTEVLDEVGTVILSAYPYGYGRPLLPAEA